MPDPSCAIQGNSDLYGLGIRIGIYSQWVSSWLRIVLDPRSAEEVHGVNAVFVLAVLVGTIIAHRDGNVRLVEVHIMLQELGRQPARGLPWCSGSSTGARSPASSPPGRRGPLMSAPGRLYAQTVRPRARFRSCLEAEADPRRASARARPLDVLAGVKSEHLSWLGVLWRVVIANILVAFNIFTWFRMSKDAEADTPCGLPTVFLFSKLPLDQQVVNLFRAASVIAGIYSLQMCILLLLCAGFMAGIILLCVLRQQLRRQVTKRAKVVETLDSAILYLMAVRRYMFMGDSEQVLLAEEGSVFLMMVACIQIVIFGIEFVQSDTISFSAIMGIIISFLSPGTHKVTRNEGVDERGAPSSRDYKVMVTVSGILTFGVVAFFIASIELTIIWNDITGVNVVRDTGQLIPFTIGCMSLCQALKGIAIMLLKKMFPSWDTQEVKVEYLEGGRIQLGIVHVEAMQLLEVRSIRTTEGSNSTRHS
ncbi:hypothetical protein CTRI78_v004655 [Colletotrichum trifolii]|uniref:Uncharacterized protein n=1 Tax=Colletotrichum trifolii TaxID=5466 RepID=A0A4R8RGM2_COLTR|nr:hypothetical protein CTRI78_v004655 [Colletotrichum trifolii]